MNKRENLYQQSPLEGWLTRSFENNLPFRSMGEFKEAMFKRREKINRLSPNLKTLRDLIREEMLKRHPTESLVVIFGEQSVGLNAPSVVFGKRVVAGCLPEGVLAFDYRAQTDVAGSEPGLHQVVLPNPFSPPGVESISLVPNEWHQVPTCNISAVKMNLSRGLYPLLEKIYSSKNPRLPLLKQTIDNNLKQRNLSMAQLMDEIFKGFLTELGLSFPQILDYEFDTFSFLNGGFELIMERWGEILELARQTQNQSERKYCRVPSPNEAPFFVISLNKPYQRARILYDATKKVFRGVSPYNENNETRELIPPFTISELYDVVNAGEVAVAWRAIPRAILLALIFDGHISGGGALYNKIVGPVFEEIFGIPYYPTTFLAPYILSSEETILGPLQYQSVACRKTAAPYLREAQEAVRGNLVSLLDFYLSIKPQEAGKIVRNFIDQNKEKLDFNQRLIFPPDRVYIFH